MSKYHVRKDENGEWVEENGRDIPDGSSIVYHYGKRAEPAGRVVSRIRSNKPHVSKNASIHADQVTQFNRECASGTHYEAGTGNLVSTSSTAREREARRRAMSFS